MNSSKRAVKFEGLSASRIAELAVVHAPDVIAPTLQPGGFVMQPRAMRSFNRTIEMEACFFVAIFCAVQTRLIHRVIGRFSQSFQSHHIDSGDNPVFVHHSGNGPRASFAFTTPLPPID